MNKKSNLVIGAIFVILGVLFLMGNFGFNIIGFTVGSFFSLLAKFWPALFMLLPGIAFHYSFFKGNRSDPGVLVPGGILLILGLAFQFNMLFGGWGVTWPLYIFSVAFGLFELYWFGNRDRGLLIPVGILGGVSIISFSANSLRAIFSMSASRVLVPVVLIVVGLVVFFRGRGKS